MPPAPGSMHPITPVRLTKEENDSLVDLAARDDARGFGRALRELGAQYNVPAHYVLDTVSGESGRNLAHVMARHGSASTIGLLARMAMSSSSSSSSSIEPTAATVLHTLLGE